MTELSDELLVAYVDGQLARKQTQAVEKVLEQDDVIAKRVAALKNAHGRLEAAFEAILTGEEADAAATPTPHPPGLFIAWATLGKVSLATCRVGGGVPHAACGFWLASRHSRIFAANPRASPIRTMSAASRRVGRRTPPARTPC